MNAELFGISVENLVVSRIDGDMADVQLACAEEQQIALAQVVQADFLACCGLIIGYARKFNSKRVLEDAFDERGAVEGLGLVGGSSKDVRRTQVFLAVSDQCVTLKFSQSGAGVIRIFRLGRYVLRCGHPRCVLQARTRSLRG